MTNLISIILPCHKAEAFIAAMLQDITNQTYTNWELIIVSNGGGRTSNLK